MASICGDDLWPCIIYTSPLLLSHHKFVVTSMYLTLWSLLASLWGLTQNLTWTKHTRQLTSKPKASRAYHTHFRTSLPFGPTIKTACRSGLVERRLPRAPLATANVTAGCAGGRFHLRGRLTDFCPNMDTGCGGAGRCRDMGEKGKHHNITMAALQYHSQPLSLPITVCSSTGIHRLGSKNPPLWISAGWRHTTLHLHTVEELLGWRPRCLI